MALDARWVDAIHARLLVRYGTRWVNLWAGIPEELVKADWAEQLAGLGGPSIQHALEHLPPEFPPTAAQFKALALSRADEAPPALPAPKADPRRVAAIMAGLQRRQQRDPKAWARDLRDREMNHGGVLVNGKRMTQAQRDMWRRALDEQDAQPQDAEDIDYAARERRQAEQERIRQYAAERGLPLANGG